ncbi:alpha/beta-hydrolase [Basidiobolus meristosporus CBS 931.73]|uniref:Alpha/beta-hydrolase n=1 Tax=Basidiobolus meristosporus CBS 931.73 TaxID=1314790 RepID=A0A1Y1ZBG6_9FUNG|nr:alpha/beta-hydrolase [Basidiobolus meristosporus CBS 931.73]|eukprot:ORY07589.1 alpha/beta-hydrolase [Basidiobolus meristosporus CBS 931.73]
MFDYVSNRVNHLLQTNTFRQKNRQGTHLENSDVAVCGSTERIILDGPNKDNIFLVPGLFSYSKCKIKNPFTKDSEFTLLDYWSDIRMALPEAIPLEPSSIGSLHDRACQIFYQLKGGLVDYGKEHSRKFCHSQYGSSYPGHHRLWDEKHPVVLIGKDYGVQTCSYLQYLLAIDYFKCNTNARWIKAIVSISGSHRGSTLNYLFGLIPGTRIIVHPFSLLQLFLVFVHLVCWLDWVWLNSLLPFQLNDRWDLSRRKGGSFWCALFARSAFSSFEDNWIYDYSVEGSNRTSTLYHLDPKCLYINYAISTSLRSRITGRHFPRVTHLWSMVPGFFLGRQQFDSYTVGDILKDPSEKFWENNGLLSLVSQMPPVHHPMHLHLVLHKKIFDPIDQQLNAGVWHNVLVNDPRNMKLFERGAITNHRTHLFKIDMQILKLIEFYEHTLLTLCIIMTKWETGQTLSPKVPPRSIERKNNEEAEHWVKSIEEKYLIESPSSILSSFDQSHGRSPTQEILSVMHRRT